MESSVNKELGFTQTIANRISMSGKVAGLFGPLFGMTIDLVPYRQYWLLFAAIEKIFWSLFLYKQKTYDQDDKMGPLGWYVVKIVDSTVNGLFYSAFYSFFGMYLPKEIKGV